LVLIKVHVYMCARLKVKNIYRYMKLFDSNIGVRMYMRAGKIG